MQDNENVLENLWQARNPEEYAKSAALVRELGEQTLARLEFMTLQPQVIVDVGCGVGDSTRLLHERYPQAKIIALDSTESMVAYAQKQPIPNVEWTHAPLDHLPLQSSSVDLLVANLVLPWCSHLELFINEWRRVLRPDGLLMLTTLGPDTLHELHKTSLLLPHMIDMHNVGDALVQAGFADPVLDVDYFTLTYRDHARLFQELQATAMIAGDTSHIQLEKNADEVYPLTYEVIFAHAWGPAGHTADETGVVKIPISHILRR